jgi:hypothetical protein
MPVHEQTIATLIDAVRRVSGSLDLDEVLDTTFDSLKELIDYSAAVICIIDPRTHALFEVRTRGYPPQVIGDDFLQSGGGIIGWVIKNARGEIVNKARAETRSEIAAPLIRADGAVIGVINLEADRVDRYSEPDLELLTMFAALTASAVDHTLLYREVLRQRQAESEIELARKVVEGLLPRAFPNYTGLDIYGTTIPVREVGGDYLDVIDQISDRLGVLVADVSGKGLAAALIMVTFRAYVHATVINELAMRVVMTRIIRRCCCAATAAASCYRMAACRSACLKRRATRNRSPSYVRATCWCYTRMGSSKRATRKTRCSVCRGLNSWCEPTKVNALTTSCRRSPVRFTNIPLTWTAPKMI